ncbi:hypothetical protein FG386_000927 [Cryptosporidium ryanae]|uniref:uncharacterized protein n=1 Tax=Cryptosporidium ryanae TaxID=515981 RepID=UPI00351A67A2|nr:hypothetical protein FG386_000927 [Cryptosporidium ryanae]
MVFNSCNEDVIGLLSSFLPYDEIINNARNVNKTWRDSIHNSYYCWKNIDLTEIIFDIKSEDGLNFMEEIKVHSNIVESIRLSNPSNNITGFLSKLIKDRNTFSFVKWENLTNIEIYNKSLIMPLNTKNIKYKHLPINSLFRLGINEEIMQLLKNYELINDKVGGEGIKLIKEISSIELYPFCGVKRLVIDYPISTKELNVLSNCFPSLNDIVITRLFHEKDGEDDEDEITSCWDAVYNFLQVIPPNQLRILQFNIIPCPNSNSGEWNVDNTISKIINGDNNKTKNSKEETYTYIKRNNVEYINNRNKIMRLNEYYNSTCMGAGVNNNDITSMLNFEEKGDKLMRYILDMHSDSLVSLSCPDLEISYSLYKKLLKYCPNLKLWDLPGWRVFSLIN